MVKWACLNQEIKEKGYTIIISHDQNVKNLILDYPKESVKFFAAPESDDIDNVVRIIPTRQEQLKELLGDRFREVDTPILFEWPDGRREGILFLFEEESVTSRFSIRRLVHYCTDISDLMKTNRIVPVVIFLHSGNYDLSLELGTEYHTFLSFNYIACNLRQIQAIDYQNSDNIVARLNLPLMRYNEDERVEVYASAVEGLVTLEPRLERQRKYIDYIDCYAKLSPQQLDTYKTQYVAKSERKDKIMGLLKHTRDEGYHQAGVDILLHQMEDKFGHLTDDLRSRIELADSKTLLKWSTNILKAEKPDDIFH